MVNLGVIFAMTKSHQILRKKRVHPARKILATPMVVCKPGKS